MLFKKNLLNIIMNMLNAQKDLLYENLISKQLSFVFINFVDLTS